MTLNPLPPCSSKPHKYNNYDKATYIVFSTPSLFSCSQATGFAWNPHPRYQEHSAKGVSNFKCEISKGVFQIYPNVSGVNFSNNISVSQVRVNIKETEHGITFEISLTITTFRIKTFMVLQNGQGLIFKWRFKVFRLLKNAFIIYETPPKPWHNLIISPPILNNPHIFFCSKFVMKSFSFGKNPLIL